MEYSELELQYLNAKNAYYDGNPIISDEEFDLLEQELKNLNSNVINIVGSTDRNAKFLHISPMLSLAKIQMSNSDNGYSEFKKWYNDINFNIFEITPKYDGNAINIIYKNGKLFKILSRGDGEKGRDYTNKLINIIPNEIDNTNVVEIRGEILIKKDIFNKKYSQFMNPRNFIAGILNRDEDVTEIVKDMDFIAYEYRVHNESIDFYPNSYIQYLIDWGFNTPKFSVVTIENIDVYSSVIENFTEYRQNSEYQLDGIVFKIYDNEIRDILGFTDHHPKWAIAVKFIPEEVSTIIEGIEWNVGKTGAIIPTILLKSVLLDGSVISRTAGHNARNLIDKGLWKDAKVGIAKAGDIIPEIQSVYLKSNNVNIPTICPCGKNGVYTDSVHIYCNGHKNNSCDLENIKRLYFAIIACKIERIGESTVEKLYEAGIREVLDLFNDDLEWNLIASGKFKGGRALDIIIKEINKIKNNGIYLWQLIQSMGIPNLGKSIAKQLSKKYSGLIPDYSNLEKSIINSFSDNSINDLKVKEMINKSKVLNLIIKFDEVLTNEIIKYEMTGSPTTHKTKEEFSTWIIGHGWIHSSLKEADYLITDSLNSTTSKMISAKKKGIKIKTYEQILNQLSI